MTKTELIAKIAEQLGISKKLAGEFVNTFASTVIAGVKADGEVRIQGFGTFKVSHREARTGVNPKDPSQKIKIPARNVPSFRAGSEFKKSVN
jgi:nucleoid DNA-binding protein